MAIAKADREAQVLIEESLQVAEKLKIKKLLVVCERIALWNSILPHYAKNQFIIAVSGKKLAESIKVETFLCDYGLVARPDRLAYILKAAVESGKLVKGERVLCLYSLGDFYGVALSWPARLLGVLEVLLGRAEDGQARILAYEVHPFGRSKRGGEPVIVPIDRLPAGARGRCRNRLRLLFGGAA